MTREEMIEKLVEWYSGSSELDDDIAEARTQAIDRAVDYYCDTQLNDDIEEEVDALMGEAIAEYREELKGKTDEELRHDLDEDGEHPV
jgi:hypothetical protein